MKLRNFAFALVLLPALQQDACQSMVDPEVLNGVRQYFPYAHIEKCYRSMLQIETHVGNVSPKFADETLRALLQGNRGKELMKAMQTGQYTWLSLGFEGFQIVWTPGGQPGILTQDYATQQWLLHTFGYVAAPGTCPRVG